MTITPVIVPDHVELSHLADAVLLAMQADIAAARRQLDAEGALVAAELSRRSAPELGHSGLAQRAGARTPEGLLQRVAGVTRAEARAMIRVGSVLDGSAPWLAPVAAAVAAGELSVAAYSSADITTCSPTTTSRKSGSTTTPTGSSHHRASTLAAPRFPRSGGDDGPTTGCPQRSATLAQRIDSYVRLTQTVPTQVVLYPATLSQSACRQCRRMESHMAVYAAPGSPDAKVVFKPRYEHWIGGEWVKPVQGRYFEDISPVNGKPFAEVARGTAEDIDAALDAAHRAAPAWGKTSATERAAVLNKIADVIEANLELLAVAETWDNGKPIREPLNADLPLAADHFRYFASVIRAQEGHFAEMDGDMTAYHYKEPLGVVGQIIPWNFPILMAVWKLAPALAAGNAIVLKPAEQTPVSILVLIELIGDILPPGVVNIVNGFGAEAGKPLASSPRIRKIAFTGETTTGRLILQYASANIIPATLELGGKSPNLFFSDVAQENDAFYDKAQEGFVLFAFNQGEVCTCPSRALIQKPIYDSFLGDAIERTKKVVQGNPLDTDTQVGAQSSNDQLEEILSYVDIGKQEGAKLALGGERVDLGGDLSDGYYMAPTIFEGHNQMRLFQEEIFGPVVAVTSFDDYDDGISIANDTLYGLGAGVWSRNGNVAYRAGRDIQAGRVWVNNYHAYPAGAAFGGYKSSGIGRENNALALDHYQQTKNLLVSYSENKLGFF